MEYQWGKIKDAIKKYVLKAFNENNYLYTDALIDKALVMFNNLITCRSGYALLDGMADKMKPAKDKAVFMHDEVTTAMAALRKPIDALEMIVAKDMWPVPSYGDLIFEV